MAALDQSARFGPLLQRHRLAAGLSQDELAERAGLSRRGISDLERGARRPHPGTARRLAVALELAGQPRLDFFSAAQWKPRASVVNRRAESKLSIPLSSFVGRERELAQIRSLLQTVRLLTLTGTGGVGKTRLAREVGRGLDAEGRQRVCLVELAPITDGSAVARAAAAALGLADQAGRPPIETLQYALRNEQLLLILDNCEHVLQGCAELAQVVLGACPHVCILATSRERLGVVGETCWRVPSLTVPSEGMSLKDMKACDATQLFLERAMALVPDFAVSEQNASAVARLCNTLDGIPLAIELAAARLPALSIEQIAEHLDDALRLLVQGNRTAPPRQQTLRATIAWSYALLDPEEQLLFERLSVFAGGWTLGAAEQVCADPDAIATSVRISRQDVLDLLAPLVAKSLVIATPDGNGAMRYHLLETLRQYGRERLVERAELEATNDRHAEFFMAWARRTMPPSDTLIPVLATSVEMDNLRVALRWLIDKRDTIRGVQLGAALRWYWFLHGRLSEGAQWFAEILALPGAHHETEELAHVLAAAALIAGRQGKASDAARLHERALALWRKLDNDLEVVRSLSQLGDLSRHTGRLVDATRYFDEGVRLSENRHLLLLEARIRLGLAETMYDAEQYEGALSQAGQALELNEALGYGRGLAQAKRAIGLMYYQRGAWKLARRFLEESLAEARKEEGRGWWVADAIACVAQLDVDSRQLDRAGTLLREALELSMALGDQRMIARCLERLAYLAAVQGRSKRAVRLAAAAGALRTSAGLPRAPVESQMLERWLAPAEERLEPATREKARREGATMALERVLIDALEATASGDAEAPADLPRAGDSNHRLSVRDGLIVPPVGQEQGLASAGAALWRKGTGLASIAGAGLNAAEAIEWAPSMLKARPRDVDSAQGQSSQLSPRERDVALLVARGLSNPGIASQLIIGERTVQTHVSNILAKLGMSSRVQIAGWVAEQYGPVAARHDP